MSTRTYKLRTRAVAGVATQPTAQNVSTTRRVVSPLARDPPPHMGNRVPLSNVPPLYSEVVSRTPSPLRENSSVTVGNDRAGPINEQVTISQLEPEERVVHTNDNEVVEKADNLTSRDESDPPQDQEDAPWTTVQRRRTRSLGSLDRVRNLNHSGDSGAKGLTLDQIQVVNAATNALTNSQRRTLHEREKRTA